jgi:hypothetical protein
MAIALLIAKKEGLVSTAEDFAQIRMYFIDPLQHDYEVVRPLLFFGETAAERSCQTGIDRTVIGDKARRFVTDGTDHGKIEPSRWPMLRFLFEVLVDCMGWNWAAHLASRWMRQRDC